MAIEPRCAAKRVCCSGARKRWWYCVPLVLGGVPAVHAECMAVALARPAALETVADVQPLLAWPAEPGAADRVQVAVLQPEARLVASYDLEVTGGQWRLPDPLTLAQAAVKVRISRHCPDAQAQDLHAQPPSFFVDLRKACALAPQSLHWQAGQAAWRPVQEAQAYRVRLMRPAAAPGAPMSQHGQWQVDAPSLALPAGAVRPADVLVVQAVCGGIAGRPMALALP